VHTFEAVEALRLGRIVVEIGFSTPGTRFAYLFGDYSVESYAAFVADVLKELLRPEHIVNLIGQSMGCIVANAVVERLQNYFVCMSTTMEQPAYNPRGLREQAKLLFGGLAVLAGAGEAIRQATARMDTELSDRLAVMVAMITDKLAQALIATDTDLSTEDRKQHALHEASFVRSALRINPFVQACLELMKGRKELFSQTPTCFLGQADHIVNKGDQIRYIGRAMGRKKRQCERHGIVLHADVQTVVRNIPGGHIEQFVHGAHSEEVARQEAVVIRQLVQLADELRRHQDLPTIINDLIAAGVKIEVMPVTQIEQGSAMVDAAVQLYRDLKRQQHKPEQIYLPMYVMPIIDRCMAGREARHVRRRLPARIFRSRAIPVGAGAS
jgi:pimeloyl-ACP methyl ester carboxylesterase